MLGKPINDILLEEGKCVSFLESEKINLNRGHAQLGSSATSWMDQHPQNITYDTGAQGRHLEFPPLSSLTNPEHPIGQPCAHSWPTRFQDGPIDHSRASHWPAMCTKLANQIWGINKKYICEKIHLCIHSQSQNSCNFWSTETYQVWKQVLICLTNIMVGMKRKS